MTCRCFWTQVFKFTVKMYYIISSHLFLGNWREMDLSLIFNLKGLNKHNAYHHFKMQFLESVIQLMEKDYYMAPANLKGTSHSISISIYAQKYLKFTWQGKLNQSMPTLWSVLCNKNVHKIAKTCPIYSTIERPHVCKLHRIYMQGKTLWCR